MTEQHDDVPAAAPEAAAGEQPKTHEDIWQELEDEEQAAAGEPDPDASVGWDKEPAEDDDPLPEMPQEDVDDVDDGPTQDEIQALDAKIEDLEQKYRSELGRPGQGHQARAEQHRKELERLAAAKLRAADSNGEGRRKKLDEISEEYGDVVAPIVDHIRDLEGRLESERQEALSNRQRELNESIQAIEQQEEQVLLQEHPDGFQVVQENAEVFKAWIEDQPKLYRDIYAANFQSMTDGKGAALLIHRFKSELANSRPPATAQPENRLASRRQRQLEGAETTRRTSRQPTVSDPPADTEDRQAHWDYFDRLEEAKARR